jgi:hypothetical protein
VSRHFYLLRVTDDQLITRTSERTTAASLITEEILVSA